MNGAQAPASGSAAPVPALELRGLTVRYDTVQALVDIDLSVHTGRITGLLGTNGSGKSTLYGAVMGRVKTSGGSVRIFGEAPARARSQSLVAYMPQSEAIDWDFPISVAEVVLTGCYGRLGPARIPRQEHLREVSEALERVGLAPLRDRQIGELSGGQRKRVFIARTIVQKARLLLLDEPFAGVDRASELAISALLRELRDDGCAIVISTHDLAGVPELCDRVVLLKNRVLFEGTAEEALAPANLARVFGLEAS